MKFVGLHAHSLSVGDSIGYPEDHFKFVVENAGDESMALAITDHGTAISYGYMIQAYQNLKKKGVPFKPLFGVEAYFHPDLDMWKREKELDAVTKKSIKVEEENDLVVENESDSKDKTKWYNPLNRRHHLVIVAQNKVGLKNLNNLISESYMYGFYRYPRMDMRMLEKYNEGLIISTACLGGFPSWLILRDKDKGEEVVMKSLMADLKPVLDIFGDRAYLELQFNKIPEQKIVNEYLVKMAAVTGNKLIATADSHYARPEWWKEREIYKMLAMQTKGFDVDKDRLPKSIDELKCELFPKNGDQMFEAYKLYHPELDDKLVQDAIERTWDIAHNQCDIIMPDGKFRLPITKNELIPDELLSKMTLEALAVKCKKDNFDTNQNLIYSQRVVEELRVINSKGYANYFLVLKQALGEIQKEYITGCGRGSGAGSLVCYLLEITKVDPIKNNLLFERFLSENRTEAPDIDNDVEDRDGALRILRDTFGENSIVAISNFNTLQLKSLIKDLAKVEGIPFEEVNKVTSQMETEARNKILDEIGHDQKLYVFDFDGAMKHSPTFNAFIQKYPNLADNVKILFKQLRVISKHAGGVAIVDDAQGAMPLIKIRGELQTPWTEGLTAKHLEQFGIIKYDFLGLATLRTIRNCIERVLEFEGKPQTFEYINNFYNCNLHPDVLGQGDPNIFKAIYHKQKWISIFQFTERKAQEFCTAAQPLCVNDISAITAIFRPGPLKAGADKAWVEAVQGGKVTFDHPVLEEILGPTRGQLCYQEQFMLLAHKLAGFSLTESDELRKLLVKPVQSLGEQMKVKRVEAGEKFIKGCIDNGLSDTRANRLWNEEIMGFISYGFNKSHSDCYAYISYQCAWLLYNHPSQWIAAVLETETSATAEDKSSIISIVRSFGYEIRFPDINQSKERWSIVNDKTFQAPLTLIKGIGDKALKQLVGNAPYLNIEQLMFNPNIDYRAMNKRIMNGLCLSGALIPLQDERFDNDRHFYTCAVSDKKPSSPKKFLEKIAAEKGKYEGMTKDEQFGNKLHLLGFLDLDLLIPIEVRQKLLEKNIPSITQYDEDCDVFCWFYVQFAEKKVSKKGNEYHLLKIVGSGLDEHEIYLFGYDGIVQANICGVAKIAKSIGPKRWACYDGAVKWIKSTN